MQVSQFVEIPILGRINKTLRYFQRILFYDSLLILIANYNLHSVRCNHRYIRRYTGKVISAIIKYKVIFNAE